MIRALLLSHIEFTDHHQLMTAICGVCVVLTLIVVVL